MNKNNISRSKPLKSRSRSVPLPQRPSVFERLSNSSTFSSEGWKLKQEEKKAPSTEHLKPKKKKKKKKKLRSLRETEHLSSSKQTHASITPSNKNPGVIRKDQIPHSPGTTRSITKSSSQRGTSVFASKEDTKDVRKGDIEYARQSSVKLPKSKKVAPVVNKLTNSTVENDRINASNFVESKLEKTAIKSETDSNDAKEKVGDGVFGTHRFIDNYTKDAFFSEEDCEKKDNVSNSQPKDTMSGESYSGGIIDYSAIELLEESERSNLSEKSLNSEDDLSEILANFAAEVDNPSQTTLSPLPEHLTLKLSLTIVQEEHDESDEIGALKESDDNLAEALPNVASKVESPLKTPKSLTLPPRFPEHLTLGLTLSTLKKLLAMQQSNSSPSNDAINGYRSQLFAKNLGKDLNLTVCQKLEHDPELSAGVGKANVYVSWDLSTLLETLIDALEQFVEHESLLEESTFFWVGAFVMNQNNLRPDLEKVPDCVRVVGCTVLLLDPWKYSDSLRSLDCIQDLYFTHASNSTLHLIMRKEQQENFEITLQTDFFSNINVVSLIDVAQAECLKKEDKDRILERLRNSVGFARCNELVIEQLKNAITTHASKAIHRLPKEQLAITNLLSCVSIVMEDLGRYDEAYTLKEESVTLGREVLGPKDRNTLTRIGNLAAFLRQQGRFDEARSLYEESLAGRREVLGSSDPDTLLAMSNYAIFLKQQGFYEESRKLYEEALIVQRKVLGSKHRNTLTTIIGLALLLHEQGQSKEARLLYEEAVYRYRDVFGSMHAYTLTVIHNFACFLRDQECYDESRPLFEEAVAGRKVTLGPNHPHTQWSNFFLKHNHDEKKSIKSITMKW